MRFEKNNLVISEQSQGLKNYIPSVAFLWCEENNNFQTGLE